MTYNQKVWKPAISGCYATSLSLATPANIRKFQKFLMTSPEPHGKYFTWACNSSVIVYCDKPRMFIVGA